MHMHVDPNALCSSPSRAEAQIRHLGAHTRKAHETFDSIGDVASILVAEDKGGSFYVAGLVVVEADDIDKFV